jgi:uncharacterized protein YegL
MADTNIYLIIDGSGSMSNVKHDVVSGINDFIKEQQADAAKTGDPTQLWLTVFDSNVSQVYDQEDILLVNPVTLRETYLGGGTALLDAIGKTLTHAEDKAASRNLVVIYTDGEENQSTEFKHKDIEELINKLDKSGTWQFIYLGAEFGAFQKDRAYAAVASAGVGTVSSMNTTKGNSAKTFANVSQTANYMRSATPDQFSTIKTRGGIVAAAAEDAAVDWDDVDESKKETK